ncbi:MAG: hypothetical protein NT022_00035 [Deltaproteobacteria bacterium]|nr:hypothetical protein [Deltaproteobacteria bacterium]
MTKDQIIKALKTAIEVLGTHNESECAGLLLEVCNILLPTDQGHIQYVDSEQSVYSGRVDLIVYADAVETFGSIRRIIYVWELKAPQLSLFSIDTNSRARPTDHLYDAENQLIHYHDSLCNNSSFLETHKILSAKDVKFGGIIIGRFNNYVEHRSMNEEKAKNLAEHALRMRQDLFYTPRGIKIWTWDTILMKARLLAQSFTTIKGDDSTQLHATLNATLPALTIKATGHIN